MKINITDIPPEGRELAFSLSVERLSARAGTDRITHTEHGEVLPPAFMFRDSNARLHLTLQGSTVILSGECAARYTTQCCRCVEETEKSISVPVHMVLKPMPVRADDRVEDVDLGFYNGREVDCAPIVEELLMLSLPFAVFCKDDCQGLCSSCGANRNTGKCACSDEARGDERFALLRELKLQ
jgi:uncharacterized protein